MGSTSHPEQDGQNEVAVLPRTRLRRPRRYAVVLHNDDYTTMDFVEEVLVRFFAKTATEATRVMLEVHHRGHGVAGTYIRDVAETKADQVVRFARENGHPLLCSAEPLPSDPESPGDR
jgi:ATP-dependent Clp protease adaptor protein ClpS